MIQKGPLDTGQLTKLCNIITITPSFITVSNYPMLKFREAICVFIVIHESAFAIATRHIWLARSIFQDS